MVEADDNDRKAEVGRVVRVKVDRRDRGLRFDGRNERLRYRQERNEIEGMDLKQGRGRERDSGQEWIKKVVGQDGQIAKVDEGNRWIKRKEEDRGR